MATFTLSCAYFFRVFRLYRHFSCFPPQHSLNLWIHPQWLWEPRILKNCTPRLCAGFPTQLSKCALTNFSFRCCTMTRNLPTKDFLNKTLDYKRKYKKKKTNKQQKDATLDGWNMHCSVDTAWTSSKRNTDLDSAPGGAQWIGYKEPPHFLCRKWTSRRGLSFSLLKSLGLPTWDLCKVGPINTPLWNGIEPMRPAYPQE